MFLPHITLPLRLIPYSFTSRWYFEVVANKLTNASRPINCSTMFNQTWNKYLPVIRILLKKAVTEEQVLSMNQTDFNRAAGGKKVKYSFSIHVQRGRLQDADKASPIARQLVETLLNEDQTRKLIKENDFDFSMNKQYQLTITHTGTVEIHEDSGPEDSSGENPEE